MKNIVFDSSSVISLVTNDLLWVLKPLKEKFNGEFCIPPSVKEELIDYPLQTNRFKFEAVQVQSFIERDILTLKQKIDVTDLLHKVNHIYFANGENIRILHHGEVEALALAVFGKADAYIVDERTMRWIVEDPIALKDLLESKLHIKIQMDIAMARNFKDFVKDLKIIRSTELIMMAYELGLLKDYVTKAFGVQELVEGILWALRLKGCAISSEEIRELVSMESR